MIGNKEPYIPEGNSPILANSGFVHTDDIIYNPDTKTVTCEKSIDGFNSQIYSKSGYKDSLFISFKPSQTTIYIVFGLDENPSAGAGSTNFIASWYLAPSGQLYILEGNVQITPAIAYSTYDTNTELRIEYSGGYVRYYHNGVLVRSVARAIGNPLYLDSSFYNSGAVYDLDFGTCITTPFGTSFADLGTINPNTTTNITIPDYMQKDTGVYLLSFGNNFGESAIYIISSSNNQSTEKVRITPLKTTSYLTLASTSTNYTISVTVGGAKFEVGICQLAS